jgi:hypothetical protein
MILGKSVISSPDFYIKSSIHNTEINGFYAPGDYAFGLSPPLWRPQIAIERTQ